MFALWINQRVQKSLPQLKGIPIVPVSAIEGSGTDLLIQTSTEVFEIWQKRIPTGPLNRWLENMIQSHPPPISGGRRLKLRFITQVKARPPSFVLFTTRPGALPESYSRYLINGLRERFNLWGVPIRLTLRQRQNPYVNWSEWSRPFWARCVSPLPSKKDEPSLTKISVIRLGSRMVEESSPGYASARIEVRMAPGLIRLIRRFVWDTSSAHVRARASSAVLDTA